VIVLLRWLVGLLVLGLLLGIGAVAVYVFLPGPGPTPPATVDFAALDDAGREALMARGEAVARAADCAACHTADGGPALAGGLPLESPLGRIYSTNITPSVDHGIANWTADDLYSAMVWGIARGGRHLYPAMPYPSYHAVDRADVDALWAWLIAQRPVDLPNRTSELPFPFNVRPAIAFWNFLFLPDATTLPDAPAESDEWRRGRYLVDVLGHCGECHTPRNLAYAKTDEHLQGGLIEGATAPNITPAALAARGFTREDLAAFLRTGLSPQGVMTFNMYPVLEHSTRYLSDEDLAAMVTYLFDGAALPEAAPAPADSLPGHPGERLYLGLCAGCHGSDGEGFPHGSVPLDTNTTAMLEDPRNLIRVITEGIPAHRLASGGRMQEMPGFADRMTTAEVAALTNYLRERWGRQPGDIPEATVARILKGGN
jgi:mono/diheme cytochrome c family protein